MKSCRSDECQRLTTNFHQSGCGRRGPRRGGAWGASSSLNILHYLSGLLAPCVEIWPCSLLRPGVHKLYEKLHFNPVCMLERATTATTAFFIYNAALSDDVHMPAFIPLCSVFALLPSASILNMVCIDLFSSTN